MHHFSPEAYDIVIASSLFTAVLCFMLRPLAIKASFVDKPNQRKTHLFSTPLTGGMSVLLSSFFTLLIFVDPLPGDLIVQLGFLGLMFLLGLIDDQYDLRASTKLVGQTAITLAFIIWCGCEVKSLGTPFSFSAPLELGVLSIPFSLLAILVVTNAFNMIDGCDGLASSLTIIALLSVLIIGYRDLSGSSMVILLVVLSSLAVFLLFNFSNSISFKTFLGDSGSLFIGFVVAISLVNLAESNEDYDQSIVLWLAAVPIFDFFAVIARRLILKRAMTAADRSHIHHYVMSRGFAHLQTTIMISVAAVVLVLFGVFITSHYPSFSLLCFFMLFVFYLLVRCLDRRSA